MSSSESTRSEDPTEDPLTRAFGYPYPVPNVADYLFDRGVVQSLPADFGFGDRLPILAVGSNRSPEQLLRKYGANHCIPVTQIALNDVDVGYCAYMTHYGSVPATLMQATNTRVTLKITWLTAAQLSLMHQTESVGPHTLFGTLPVDEFTLAGRTYRKAYTYVSARGLYPVDQGVRAVVDIPAQRRQFFAVRQRQMLDSVWRVHGDGSLDAWLMQMINTPSLREALNESMGVQAVHALPVGFKAVDPNTLKPESRR